MAHPLAHLLDEAAHGRFPPADGALRVLPPLPGQADALVAFTGAFVLAADIDAAEVAARVAPGDLSIPLSAAFVTWVAQRLGARAATHDVVLVALATDDEHHDPEVALDRVVLDHPRVARADRHRHGLRVYAPVGGGGVLVLGRGITNRWEIAFEVDRDARGRGLGRALARAALGLLPAGTPVWAQVAPGNAASLRAVVGAGYRPVGAEVLFPRP